ncbi:phospholipid-transporting ATPase ABCA1-like [Pecten maximus]|uniref:phospholipid-transporting ATPase ABCA1-like n=1 Tax=Pecten maximus TaxID=6579 RepID=UPI0014581509|nr:phospholipid-transporting ATPase ABCA1-like [Pecten maximus]
MGFGNQLSLLLWKNFTLRWRQKYRVLVEVLAPLILVFVLVGVRTRPDLKWNHPECHFDGKSMPSVGIVPFLQSFFCTFNNTCYETVTPNEMAGNTADYKDSLMTKLVEDVTDVLNNNMDRKLIMDLIGTWDIITSLSAKILNGSTRGHVKVLSLFKNPRELVQDIVSNNITLTEGSLVNLLNASIDFSQFNRPHLSDVLRDFEVCPRIGKSIGPKKSAEEVRDFVCSSDSMLESFRFKNIAARRTVQAELCRIPEAHLVKLYELFKNKYSIQHFIFQVLRFVFMNTGKIPNVTKIYGKLKELFKDVKDLDSADAAAFEKPIKDLIDFFSKKGKPSPQVIMEQMGKFVCGRNSFMQMQSTKSLDILDRFNSFKRPDIKDDKNKGKNDYGPNSPVCMELVELMNANVNTQILWKNLRPVVLGKIPYAPDTPAVREIIKGANQTFADLAKMVKLAEDWEEYAVYLERYLKTSPTMDMIRAFSTSCLCDLLESKTMSLIKSKANSDKVLSKSVCHFLQTYLSKDPKADGNFDWERTLHYTKIFARVVAEYGKCFQFNKFVGYASEEELIENSLDMIEEDSFWGALVFDVEPGADQLPTHLSYKIRMDTTKVDDTKRVTDKYWRPGPRRRAGTETKYLTYGFAYLQDMVDHAVIKLQTGRDDDTGVILQQFPYPCYTEDSFMEVISKTLPLFLILAWVFPVALLCKNIVYEKEKRLKEMMKIMGLGNGVHWMAWFINAFVTMFVTITLLVVICKYGKIIQHSDPVILLLFFISFCVATISMVFMISVFFSQANLAACSAGFLYFLMYQPYSFAKRWEDVLSGVHKMAFCFSSNVAFGFGCTYIARFEEQNTGVQWSNIAQSPLVDDGFSMLYCILMLWLDSILYGLITWYIEAVFPGQYGIPRPFYFFCLKSYWCGTGNKVKGENEEREDNPYEAEPVTGTNMEVEPTSRNLGVSIRNLRKVYGKKVAVDGLNINFYEGQITSFLGHNGAGKTTTMSILTGLFPPTNGMAYVYGQDITTQMEEIRSSLGLCPQYNALFPYLTLKEHLWFYARLKGLTNVQAMAETKQLIQDIKLPHKKHALPKMLSGGMKRKLSVAIAFVGNAKTVILDEPTAGVDPYSRRSIWELLLKFKQDRTILLSTHHMDEADVLGDRIAIISQGKLCCCGSSLFLKSRYGNGYYMTMVREGAEEIDEDNDEYEMIYENALPILKPKRREARLDVDEGFAERSNDNDISFLMPTPPPDGDLKPAFSEKRLTAFIKKFVMEAKLVESNKSELTYQLPEYGTQTGEFVFMFEELERCHKEMGISSFGISDTSLEEVFLKVAETVNETDQQVVKSPTDEVKRKRLEEVSDGGRVPRPVTQMSFRRNKRQSFLRVTPRQQLQEIQEQQVQEQMENSSEGREEVVYLEPMTVIKREVGFNHKEQVKLEGKRLMWHQFLAVFIRRFHHFKRSKKGFVCELVMPAFFVLLAMVFAEIDPPLTDSPPLELHPWKLLPPRGNSRLNIFYSNDAKGTKFTEESVKTLLSKYGVGNRCLNPDVYTIDGFPCEELNTNSIWTEAENWNQADNITCSCSTGVQQCPAGAGGPVPKRRLLPTSDFLYDLTDRNITDWLVKTVRSYRKRRYGGLSFGMKSKWAQFNTDHIKQIINTLREASTESNRSFRNVLGGINAIMGRVAVHNISKVWYNNKGWPAVVIYMNVMNNIILRSKLQSHQDPNNYGISTTNHPMNLTMKQSRDGASATSKTDIIISTCVIFAMSFIPASFVMILIEERILDSKHLQFVSGIHPTIYWIGNFTWDMLNYLVSAALSICIFVAFQREAYVSKTNFPALLLLLVMYGWAMIPVMYPFSRLFRVPSTAMVTLKSVNIFLGTTSTLATFILEFLADDDPTLGEVNDILKQVLLVLPQFCLGQGLLELSRSQVYTTAFKKFDLDGIVNPLKWGQVGKNLFSMFLCGLTFFLLNLLIEHNFFIHKKVGATPEEEVEDEDQDVARERARVLSEDGENDIIRIDNLTKVYKVPGGKGRHVAVDRLCLGVPKGQCFGLLGVNGAGKTTTFKMLTGYLGMTHGNAYINGFSIVTAVKEVRRSIGYCPQFDAFDPLMTAREVLCFFARIKGIPSSDIKDVVDWAITKLGLTQYADKPSGTYSGGNRRKLSTAIALIGNPSVIFLDEPTAGMDPVARRFLWNCINNIVKDGRSVILTSHSMEECEALCSRLAIMVNGRFRGIGSIQHLKTRFGDGYIVVVRIAGDQPDLDVVDVFIQETFPSANLRERHHNMLQYQLGSDVPLSHIFSEIEAVKEGFNIEDYSVSQTTLDQVFINFAKMQTDSLDSDATAVEAEDITDGLPHDNVSLRTSMTTLNTDRRTSSSTLGDSGGAERVGDGYSTIRAIPPRDRTNSEGYTTIREISQVKYSQPKPRLKRKPRVLESHNDVNGQDGFHI